MEVIRITKVTVQKTKKLSLRKSLCSEEIVTYLTPKDVFLVDTSRVYWDSKDNQYYRAQSEYGEEGYVITSGLKIL